MSVNSIVFSRIPWHFSSSTTFLHHHSSFFICSFLVLFCMDILLLLLLLLLSLASHSHAHCILHWKWTYCYKTVFVTCLAYIELNVSFVWFATRDINSMFYSHDAYCTSKCQNYIQLDCCCCNPWNERNNAPITYYCIIIIGFYEVVCKEIEKKKFVENHLLTDEIPTKLYEAFLHGNKNWLLRFSLIFLLLLSFSFKIFHFNVMNIFLCYWFWWATTTTRKWNSNVIHSFIFTKYIFRAFHRTEVRAESELLLSPFVCFLL